MLLFFPSSGRNTRAPADIASLAGRGLNSSGPQLQGTREEGWHAGQIILGHGAVSLGKATLTMDPHGQQSVTERVKSSSTWSPDPAPFELDDPGIPSKYVF